MPVACTVIASNFLAQARVLARSFRETHPGTRFVALVVDDDGTIGGDEHLSVLCPDDIGIDRVELRRRGAMFGPRGLIGTTKTILTRHLAREHGTVLFIDADSYVYADLSDVFQLAEEHGLVLSPHLPWPMSAAEAGYPLEETFLLYGVFNGGFFAVSSGASEFLDWWCDRTSRRCVEAPAQGYNYTQHWLTLATAYFDHDVLRDPGINVMWWNLYDRDVEWYGSTPWISGAPLRHFHFTGFDPGTMTLPGRRDETARAGFPGLAARPGVARLFREWTARVAAAGFEEAASTPLPFVRLADGTVFSDEARTSYREAVERSELTGAAEPPNPFDELSCPEQ